MREFRNVRSTVKPNPIVIDEYSVWINSNIAEDGDEYVYDQVQYSKNEYIKLIDERNKELEQNLTDTQIALCEVYEMIGD